jgi:predicted transcriptional regulator
MLLQSISDRSSPKLSDADISAINALCLNEKITTEDLAQVLRRQFSISKAFVRCLIQMREAWLENRD